MSSPSVPASPAAPAKGPLARLLAFPDPVNEVSARLVAGGVIAMCTATVALDQPWMTAVIAYGFVARALTGPTLSPLGQLVTRVVTPRLGLTPRPVPGPPKRFAQAIGAAFTVSALVLWLAGHTTAALVLLGLLLVPATLEAGFGYCVGCKLFAFGMRRGVIPQSVCEECADISLR